VLGDFESQVREKLEELRDLRDIGVAAAHRLRVAREVADDVVR